MGRGCLNSMCCAKYAPAGERDRWTGVLLDGVLGMRQRAIPTQCAIFSGWTKKTDVLDTSSSLPARWRWRIIAIVHPKRICPQNGDPSCFYTNNVDLNSRYEYIFINFWNFENICLRERRFILLLLCFVTMLKKRAAHYTSAPGRKRIPRPRARSQTLARTNGCVDGTGLPQWNSISHVHHYSNTIINWEAIGI